MLYRQITGSIALLLVLSACGATPTAAPSVTVAPTESATVIPTASAVPTVPTVPTATDTPAAASAPTRVVTLPPLIPVLAPSKRGVWETTVGPDTLTGNCPGGSVVPPYGPVLITPDGVQRFSWRDVQNATYGFEQLAFNRYRYAGPSGRKDGVLTMTLEFVDTTSFTMRAEYVRTLEPDCAHGYDYKGVFKFER